MKDMDKCYFAHGGRELVVGGWLTFLPGASVEGAEGLFDLPAGIPGMTPPSLPDSEATTVAALREDYNRLLAMLRAAGLLQEAAADDQPEAGGG